MLDFQIISSVWCQNKMQNNPNKQTKKTFYHLASKNRQSWQLIQKYKKIIIVLIFNLCCLPNFTETKQRARGLWVWPKYLLTSYLSSWCAGWLKLALATPPSPNWISLTHTGEARPCSYLRVNVCQPVFRLLTLRLKMVIAGRGYSLLLA